MKDLGLFFVSSEWAVIRPEPDSCCENMSLDECIGDYATVEITRSNGELFSAKGVHGIYGCGTSRRNIARDEGRDTQDGDQRRKG